jgi:Protein of unknown function (DUF1566)/Divergent InlB B-repeat domain
MSAIDSRLIPNRRKDTAATDLEPIFSLRRDPSNRLQPTRQEMDVVVERDASTAQNPRLRPQVERFSAGMASALLSDERMKRAKLRDVLMLWICAMSVFSVSATLIPRGNGMVYDDVKGVTWLQDANYAKTTGAAPGGYMIWSTAYDWAQTVNVGGFSDWRLPSTAEFQAMFISTNGLGNRVVGMTNAGPFTNLDFTTALNGYWATNFFILATPDGLTPEYYLYNYMELGWTYQVDGGGGDLAWPVRSGDTAHPTNSVTAIVSPLADGSVSGAGNYPVTFPTTLAATANAGFAFQNWTVNGREVSTANPYLFTATNDIVVTANFVVAQDPTLKILAVTPQGFTLAWPANDAGFTLQQASAIEAGAWSTAAEPVTVVGANFQATILAAGVPRFFRLHQ